MRIPLVAVSVLTLLSIGMVRADEAQLKTESEPKAACHGTAIDFFSSPVVAAELAAKRNKLVMVLHVSGHFEDPNFT
jgi:hypothetical protein